MAKKTITPIRSIKGDVFVPGDKSISHRALLLSSLAEGDSRITGLSSAQDVRSTWQCLEDLGINIEEQDDVVIVHGRGKYGFQRSSIILDAGNSGTTLRLLAGVLAAQPFVTTITGDASLRNRPMRRIIEPLEMMGAQISHRDNKAPLTIHGSSLRAIDYASTMSSAQVKSCVLLAGLYAKGTTRVTEPNLSRDHTERMFANFGVTAYTSGSCAVVQGPAELWACDLQVPGDISSAAFFMVAACILREGDLLIHNIGTNPSRLGIYEALAAMGAHIQMTESHLVNNEPRASFMVKSSHLHSATFAGSMIPRIIDEIPILAVAATQAEGTTIIRDASELRIKETDRLQAISANLQNMGAEVKEEKDGLVINGPTKLRGAIVDSYGDHRIAMAFAIAGLVADGETTIKGAECVDISFPHFFKVLKKVCHA